MYSKLKICQRFSWPGLNGRIRIRNDLNSRIRIRTKSFRIHNPGRKYTRDEDRKVRDQNAPNYGPDRETAVQEAIAVIKYQLRKLNHQRRPMGAGKKLHTRDSVRKSNSISNMSVQPFIRTAHASKVQIYPTILWSGLAEAISNIGSHCSAIRLTRRVYLYIYPSSLFSALNWDRISLCRIEWMVGKGGESTAVIYCWVVPTLSQLPSPALLC